MRAHAELMKRWLEDETIEIERLHTGLWQPATCPSWNKDSEYREKPKEEKKVEMWQWAVGHRLTPRKILASKFYKNTDSLRKDYIPSVWKIICRIEGSKIEVEE